MGSIDMRRVWPAVIPATLRLSFLYLYFEGYTFYLCIM